MIVFAISFIPALVDAAPGAHGPNGEHIEVDNKVEQGVHPRFEAFTETFEILGELLDNQLVMYVHDYQTNVPVTDAAIELEMGQLVVKAEYDTQHNRYQVNHSNLVALLHSPGEHEVIITLLTQEAGDLLAAQLITPEKVKSEVHNEDHHHFPWWLIVINLGLLLAGFVIGRLTRRPKS